jgi:hypothetical protein
MLRARRSHDEPGVSDLSPHATASTCVSFPSKSATLLFAASEPVLETSAPIDCANPSALDAHVKYPPTAIVLPFGNSRSDESVPVLDFLRSFQPLTSTDRGVGL